MNYRAITSLFVLLLFSGQMIYAQAAQTRIVRLKNFDPGLQGFGFSNYGNDDEHQWQDDLGVDDLIRLHGAKAVCTSGTTAKDCVLDAAARKWLEGMMKTIDNGRCTGMAVASLRFMDGGAFKGLRGVGQFEPGAQSVFSLKNVPPIENYIAYYWLTQVFREVASVKEKTSTYKPVQIAQIIQNAIATGSERYTLAIEKYEEVGGARRKYDGHEFTPFAVEDLGKMYRLYIYDNNHPQQTRYMYISKEGDQRWWYSSADTQEDKNPDYIGNAYTETLALTANSWREKRCFRPMFGYDGPALTGCRADTAMATDRLGFEFQKASFSPQQQDYTGEDAQFFLTGDGDMMVIDNGERIGFDPRDNSFNDEVTDGIDGEILGGLGHNIPHILVPYERSGPDYILYFCGKFLDKESVMDFVFSAPDFTVGFENIRLDPGEVLIAHVSRDGQRIKFETSQKDGETPTVYYAFDSRDGSGYSYITEVGGESLSAGQWVQMNFDFAKGKLYFADNDGNEDAYDIELIRIAPNGSEQVYAQNDLEIPGNDSYEMDFGAWQGEGKPVCFREDKDGDGDFTDDGPCVLEPDEPEPPNYDDSLVIRERP